MTRDVPSRIARRAARAAVPIAPDLALALGRYLDLLARWNRKINLTGLRLDPPTDEAVDRLIIEPIAAARHMRDGERLVIDVGSGGGSPALPLKLAAPALQFVLVESKVRKAAFLREAVRHLGIGDVRVENQRLEDLAAHAELRAAADIVTLRAVRMDAGLLETIVGFLKPAGRVFAFVAGDWEQTLSGWISEQQPLVPALESKLAVLSRRL